MDDRFSEGPFGKQIKLNLTMREYVLKVINDPLRAQEKEQLIRFYGMAALEALLEKNTLKVFDNEKE